MELQGESSNLGALSVATSRNFSSSSSTFISAVQSPFLSPRSLSDHALEMVIPDARSKSGDIYLSADELTYTSLSAVPQECLSSSRILGCDVSPPPSICTSSNFGTPGMVYHNARITSSFSGICNENLSSNSEGTSEAESSRLRKKLLEKRNGKISISRPSSSSAYRRSYDVYIGFHGRKASLLRFVNWFRAELEIQEISCFVADRACCRNDRSHEAVERIMNSSSYGIVILTKKSFGNPYSIEELRHFFVKKNLVPIYFDLAASDCLSRDIIEKRGELWERHGGELWMQYGGLEREWREAVDALPRLCELQLETNEGNWRDCIMQAVVVLATMLGRRSSIDRVNQWRERLKNEFPFPRREYFIGRKKELSELELILFGDVSGDGEREYFELKTRYHKLRKLKIRQSDNHQKQLNPKGKEPVVWRESEKEIEMMRGGEKNAQVFKPKKGTRHGGKKRSRKILYGKGIACVSAESGIGKTELVLEYAYRYSQRYKMVLWIGGERRYIRQNYLSLSKFLDVDLGIKSQIQEKGGIRCFEELEEEAIARVKNELMREIPFLVIIDNLEHEKDFWDQKFIMDLLPSFGAETHFIITTRLPRVMNLEPMKLSYLSGLEAMTLMKGSIKDCPLAEIEALKVIEEKLGRLTLGLGIVGAILSELPITPSRLLDTVNRMLLKDFSSSDRDVLSLKKHTALVQLLDVCLSIFDHADGPRSLATRMVQVGSYYAPAAIPIHLLASAAQRLPRKYTSSSARNKFIDAVTCRFTESGVRRSEAEASSMLIRFGVARCSTNPECIQFHELIRAYARTTEVTRAAHAVVQSIQTWGSISHPPEHLWAACFLVFGFGLDRIVVDPSADDLIFFVKQVAFPLAVRTFATFSRCGAASELLRLSANALEHAEETLVSRSEKWMEKSFCCFGQSRSDSQHHRHLWEELALLKASVLEARAKLMLRGGQYDVGDDLIRKAIFIRTSICGEDHPDTTSARETLGKLTRLLTNVQVS